MVPYELQWSVSEHSDYGPVWATVASLWTQSIRSRMSYSDQSLNTVITVPYELQWSVSEHSQYGPIWATVTRLWSWHLIIQTVLSCASGDTKSRLNGTSNSFAGDKRSSGLVPNCRDSSLPVIVVLKDILKDHPNIDLLAGWQNGEYSYSITTSTNPLLLILYTTTASMTGQDMSLQVMVGKEQLSNDNWCIVCSTSV